MCAWLASPDVHDPKLPIVWEQALEMPRFAVPANARVFARERWEGAPLLAGFRRGAGAVLWVALPPGARGYERFPFLPQALAALGVEPPFRSSRLWAFFDYSYRLRVDPDYFADRWKRAGIGGAACRRVALLRARPRAGRVSGEADGGLSPARAFRFTPGWNSRTSASTSGRTHPEWREKTALGQDAQLDWRKLMNLQNRDCFRAVAAGVRDLTRRFDWDGINLAELYFESLEGIANPSRFTPMNADVRAEFRGAHGFDPLEVFGARQDARSRRSWLDFRAGLVRRMQEEWLAEMEAIRRERPHLDLVLTHVDDRLDAGMRDAIGADAAAVLPLLERLRFHVPGGGPGHDLAPGAAALPGNREALRGAYPAAGPPGRRHQHRRTVPGRLSDQAADRNRASCNCAHGCPRVSAGGALLRELASLCGY